MIDLKHGPFTHAELLAALLARDGTREIRFRFDLMRGGARVRPLEAEGRIEQNRFREVQRTGTFLLRDGQEVNWLTDSIRPYMLVRVPTRRTAWERIDGAGLSFSAFEAHGRDWASMEADGFPLPVGKNWRIVRGMYPAWQSLRDAKRPWAEMGGGYAPPQPESGWVEYPLGEFLPIRQERKTENGWTFLELEAGDRTLILQQDCLTERLLVGAGENYLTAVQKILAGAGISDLRVNGDCALELPVDREFEIGESRLSVINALLDEAGFRALYCDNDGHFVLEPYREPGEQEAVFAYAADALSVIERDASNACELASIPNVFLAVCSNPELQEDYRAVWINDNPASPLSTVRRGRSLVSQVYRPKMVASQQALDGWLRRVARERCQAYEQVRFTTAAMPFHGSGDLLTIRHPDFQGAFQESAWTLELTPGGVMTHQARRVVHL